LKFIL